MRKEMERQIPRRLLSLLLVFSLLLGTGGLSALAMEEPMPDGTTAESAAPEEGSQEGEASAEDDAYEEVDWLLDAAYSLVSPGDTAYYVDAENGSDDNNGIAPETAWKSLERVNQMRYAPGDSILFKAGGVWNGVLRPTGSGMEGKPNIISSYGEGPKPILNGNGTTGPAITGTVLLYNVEWWEVYNLEVTNLETTDVMGDTMDSGTAERAGILAFSSIQDRVLEHIYIKDCYVHDVNSNYSGMKTSGGIIVLGHYMDIDGNVVTVDDNGNRDPKAMGRAAYTDVLIEGNYVKNVAVEGIRNKCNTNITSSGHGVNEFLKNFSDVTISNNYIEDVVGDGIVLTETKGGLIQGNVVKNSCGFDRGNINYAQCWTMFADDVLIQYNEVYGNKYGYDDGEAFDSDMMNNRNVFQYNLSHDNGGGACLFMSNQTDSVFRYNVSINDGAGTYPGGSKFRQQTFHYDNTSANGSNVPQIYNNTIYVNGADNSTVLFGGKGARTCFVNFKNNIVLAEGGATVTFTHGDSAIHGDSIVENNCFYPESIGTSGGKSVAALAAKGNLFVDPLLTDPAAGLAYSQFGLEPEEMGTIYGLAESRVKELSAPYMLTENSPCIRVGQPIAGAPEQDIFGNAIVGLVDIGAHEFSSEPDTPSEVETVTAVTPVGMQPELPATVNVVIGGKSYVYGVSWSALTDEQLAQPGEYALEGTIAGIDTVKATATVVVVDTPTGQEPVNVTTQVKFYPALPNRVTLLFGESVKAQLPVIWDLIPNESLAAEGSFTVQGHVPDLPGEPTVEATVTVVASGGQIDRSAATWDTYVQNDNAGPFNSAETVTVKGSPDIKYGRRIVLDFDLSASPDAIESATRIVLQLSVTGVEAKAGPGAGTGENTERYLRVYDIGGGDWPATVKWNDIFSSLDQVPNAPVAVEDSLFINKDLDPNSSVIELDVTDYVKNSGKTSFQFMICILKATYISNCSLTFASNETKTGRAAPALAFTYNPVTAVEEVTASTPAGEAPVLPAKVSVTYEDSATAQMAVTWNKIKPAQYDTEGKTFDVYGTVQGVARPAVAHVTVTAPLPAITAVAALEPIRAKTGTPESGLGLPATVGVTLSDGTAATAPVSYWFPEPAYDSSNARDYAYLGVIDVAGQSFRNPDGLRPAVTVTLYQVPDKNILIYALLRAQAAVADGTYGLVVPSVQSAFSAAATAADGVYQRIDATGKEIQEAYTALQTVLWKLSYIRADKTELSAALALAAATSLDGYSEATVTAVLSAKAEAEALVTNEELSTADQSTVDMAASMLVSAIRNLSAPKPEYPSGGSTSSDTNTTANPDGSTTVTVTDKTTGTVTETTTTKDGVKAVTETKKDGTKTVVVTLPATITGNVTLPVAAVKNGESITVKTEKKATVTIPSADTKPGVVAVIVRADGTEEIVRQSVTGANGVTLKLDGSAVVKLVDNSKTFSDVPDRNWAAGAVAFASSRELFRGTGADTFTPNGPMTRAMLMTVLARFDGQDTTTGEAWYSAGMDWAKANDISDGTNPDGSISREQLAVMLYRYAQQSGMNVSTEGMAIGEFDDANGISDWATDAMRWAIAAGIITGKTATTLVPGGTATRAEVATMLMRFTSTLNEKG